MSPEREMAIPKAEQTEVAKDLFFEIFDMPFEMALKLSEMENDAGRYWKNVFSYIKNINENGKGNSMREMLAEKTLPES